MVAEEREDGPSQGKNDENKEDEDRIGGQGVVVDEYVDEPGEHAHGRYLKHIFVST